MGPFWISLLMLASFAAFGYLAARKLRIVAHLAPDPRRDHPLARLGSVVRNGFLQSRMIRRDWKPGVMHAAIFAGFMALLARKLQLIVIGYHEPFTYPGWPGALFAAGKDVVELVVLAAVAYAFWRRYVRRPARLEPNREALLILSLIAAIMVTDLAFDGFRFALFAGGDAGIAHERAFAFAGRRLGDALAALPPGVQHAGYAISYWSQLVLVFSFLVILPLGEHFHIVTALPALYFRRGRPANRVPPVDLDKLMSDDADAADVRVGAGTARDLTWKEGLDVFTCTECGRCKDACPTFLTGKPLSQKWVHDSLKRHLLAQRAALVDAPPGAAQVDGGPDAAPDAAVLPPLVPAVIAEDTLWACTTCGYCEAACPIELEHLPRFFRMRQHRVLMDGEFPHELKAVFAAYEAQSNPWGLPADARGDWARDLGVPVVTTPEEVRGLDYVFYVGSAESFDPRGQKVARAIVEILRAAGVSFAILGAAETSTGECVRRAGNEMLFRQLADTLAGTLGRLAVTRIVTGDPHAFNTLRNEYPEFAGPFDVVHHTQLIARLLDEGRIRVAASRQRVVYHDPCYLGRHNGEYEAPRAILRRLTGDAPREFALSREKAMCCGAGGARMWQEEKIGKRINVARAEQALAQAPDVIATACPYCAVMLYDGVSTLGKTDAIAVRDVAELVAAALERAPALGTPSSARASPGSA